MIYKCRGCGKTPGMIREYIVAAGYDGITPDQYVRIEEETFNPKTGKFWCTTCYLNAGMPLGKA